MIGISLDTVDRRVRAQTGERRTRQGAIGLPAVALAGHLHDPWPGRGRPNQLDPAICARILALRRAGETFAAIALALGEDGIATGHGGAQWWPATVRKVVLRAERSV